jgi:hypothetical protein
MLDDYSLEQVRPMAGREVRDSEGRSVGYVDVLFLDDDTGQPEWYGLWNGLPSGRRRIAPVRESRMDGPDVVLPWPKTVIERAPSYDDEDDRGLLRDDPDGIHISREKEEEAYRLYGVEPLSPRPEGAYVARFRALVVVTR